MVRKRGKSMKFMKILWQLPQNFIGFLIKVIGRTPLYTTYKEAKVYTWKLKSGVSLGQYIFLPFKEESPKGSYVQKRINHEYGHYIQSQRLGWLYLFVITLPSIIWGGCFGWYRRKTGTSYYWFFTEKSADRLGGVARR